MSRKKKFKGNGKKRANDGAKKERNGQGSYLDSPRTNETFERYYKTQAIVKSDEEFELLLQTLRDPLPASFRINSACFGQTQALKQIVESDDFADLIDKDGANKGISKLRWYPQELAYQLNMSRTEIRQSEKLLSLHSFLINESENGFISRQETVSFLPPVLLDVQPHHNVLDLCAAPGSKTSQICEFLQGNNQDLGSKDVNPKQGYVIANDVNNSRCYMLAHQLNRLNLPYYLITNHDASIMPNFYTTAADGSRTKVKFDRILADVPCTGDGTMRKNPEIWAKWMPSHGNHIHFLQLRIAKRAAELLAENGLMIYSTCSLNPIENEAVVLNLLRQADGALELVDVEEKLKHFKHAHGLEKWVLMQKDSKIVHSIDEVDDQYRGNLTADMFAPADVAKFNLHRCIRALPHLNNTGGFFVAVIKKVKTLSGEKEEQTVQSEPQSEPQSDSQSKPQSNPVDQEQSLEQKPKRQRVDMRTLGFKEESCRFVAKDDPDWLKIKQFYSISDDFPTQRLFYRSENGSKNMYYVTERAIDLYKSNGSNINFINFGIRAFIRTQDKHSDCSHRIAQDGLYLIYPYLSKDRIAQISGSEFEKIINCDDHVDTCNLEANTREQLDKYPSGTVVLEYKHPIKQDDGSFKELPLPFTCWKGRSTVRPFVNKYARVHYMRICGFDLSKMDAERKRIFDERQQRRTERLERNGKMSEQADANMENAEDVDDSKLDAAVEDADDSKLDGDEPAAVDELKDDEIELEE